MVVVYITHVTLARRGGCSPIITGSWNQCKDAIEERNEVCECVCVRAWGGGGVGEEGGGGQIKNSDTFHYTKFDGHVHDSTYRLERGPLQGS